ncbi:hypothetical protein ACQP3C_29095, partial [Escherichia coli]
HGLKELESDLAINKQRESRKQGEASKPQILPTVMHFLCLGSATSQTAPPADRQVFKRMSFAS